LHAFEERGAAFDAGEQMLTEFLLNTVATILFVRETHGFLRSQPLLRTQAIVFRYHFARTVKLCDNATHFIIECGDPRQFRGCCGANFLRPRQPSLKWRQLKFLSLRMKCFAQPEVPALQRILSAGSTQSASSALLLKTCLSQTEQSRKSAQTTRATDFLNVPKVGRIKTASYNHYNDRDDL
jgi:hypothetical protein